MRIAITGTTGGIGSAAARAARAAGCDVAEINRIEWQEISNDKCPILDEGGLDGVVFCTGTCKAVPLTKIDDGFFSETIETNCTLFMSLIRYIVKRRLYSSDGMKAIAISSISAKEGWAGGAAYCASKGALSALCRALNSELSIRKIHVEALEPGYVNTRMFRECAMRMGVPESQAADPGEFARQLIGRFTEGGRDAV